MAEQIAVPMGVNPASAIPSDATVHQRSGTPTEPVIPPLPSSADQKPGFVAPTPAPSAADKDYADFLAWKASKEAKPVVPEGTVPQFKAPTPAPAEVVDPNAAGTAVDATKAYAANDPYLQSTFGLFEIAAPKVDLARAVGNALDRGDPSLVDKAYLKEHAGDQADRLISVAENLVKHVTNEAQRTVSEVHSMAGGEEQFKTAVAAFNKNAPEYHRKAIAAGINSMNPNEIKAAVKDLLAFVKQSGSTPVEPEGHVRAGGGSPDAALGLTKAQYQAERMKLDRRARNFPDQERELTARRQLGKKLGL